MVLGLTVEGADVLADGQARLASETVTNASVGESAPVYVILGVPFRTGSLYPGNERRCSSLSGVQSGRTP
jgi:hypothetical protein